jgi:hypothetical protein
MARIRTVKPEFFKHEDLFQAEKETKLPLRIAFIGLWTVADREGRFKWKPNQLKLDCLPYDMLDFSRVLDALATRGFIEQYSDSDENLYGFIPSFGEHQVINNRETESSIINPFDASATRDPRGLCKSKGKGRERKGKEGKEDEASPSLPEHISNFSEEQKESFKKFETWIKENTPRVGEMKEPFTIDQYFKLIKNGYNSENIRKLLAAMHNWKPLLTKNLSAYLTLIKWNEKTI